MSYGPSSSLSSSSTAPPFALSHHAAHPPGPQASRRARSGAARLSSVGTRRGLNGFSSASTSTTATTAAENALSNGSHAHLEDLPLARGSADGGRRGLNERYERLEWASTAGVRRRPTTGPAASRSRPAPFPVLGRQLGSRSSPTPSPDRSITAHTPPHLTSAHFFPRSALREYSGGSGLLSLDPPVHETTADWIPFAHPHRPDADYLTPVPQRSKPTGPLARLDPDETRGRAADGAWEGRAVWDKESWVYGPSVTRPVDDEAFGSPMDINYLRHASSAHASSPLAAGSHRRPVQHAPFVPLAARRSSPLARGLVDFVLPLGETHQAQMVDAEMEGLFAQPGPGRDFGSVKQGPTDRDRSDGSSGEGREAEWGGNCIAPLQASSPPLLHHPRPRYSSPFSVLDVPHVQPDPPLSSSHYLARPPALSPPPSPAREPPFSHALRFAAQPSLVAGIAPAGPPKRFSIPVIPTGAPQPAGSPFASSNTSQSHPIDTRSSTNDLSQSQHLSPVYPPHDDQPALQPDLSPPRSRYPFPLDLRVHQQHQQHQRAAASSSASASGSAARSLPDKVPSESARRQSPAPPPLTPPVARPNGQRSTATLSLSASPPPRRPPKRPLKRLRDLSALARRFVDVEAGVDGGYASEDEPTEDGYESDETSEEIEESTEGEGESADETDGDDGA